MMRDLCLSELVQPLEATLVGDDVSFSCVSTDSRTVGVGDLFVALQGERFDAHDYLDSVAAAGATAVLVRNGTAAPLPALEVADTQRALGLLGAYNRRQFTGTLVGITGSSGKTTAKSMVAAVLARDGDTLATEGNFNNEIGVPLTLLRLEPRNEYAVVEMGAAGAGHIAWLCELGRPRIAILLNAMPAHLEGFGSLEGVAAAKGEIFDALDQDCYAVINADSPWAKQWRRRAAPAHILDFGLDAPAALTARDINSRGFDGVSFTASTPAGDIAVRLSLSGVHNVANALAATAVGLACGMALTDIRDGLESLQPVSGRQRVEASDSGARIVDDCYNANPGSVKAAIDTLADNPGRRTLVLGVMAELGDESEVMHRQIGEYARIAGIDAFVGVGPELAPAVAAFGDAAEHYADREQAAAALAGRFAEGDAVLVKGSRSAGMEHVLQALLAAAPRVEG